jgi:CRP-like cAMP-binding protein
MFDNFIDKLQQDKCKWDKIQEFFFEKNYGAKTTLLKEGEIANHIYFIKSGCIRQWFNKDGKDITFQFFVENQPVSSIESFLYNEPSVFSIETLEPTIIASMTKENFERVLELYPEVKDAILESLIWRVRVYIKLFLSRIKDTPQERYRELLEKRPDLIQRIPQHYIASYLGITPVSLSRIRNRL